MEASILSKLPREVREDIHNEVFKGVAITVVVPTPSSWKNEIDIKYYFSRDGALASTCRALKEECSVTLWRSAVWEACSETGGTVWLHHLSRVLPAHYAENIVHLRNVSIATRTDVEKWSLIPSYTSLLAFPALKSCGFIVPSCGELMGYKAAIHINGCFRFLRNLTHHTGLDRQLLRFTSKGGGVDPMKFLDKKLDIPEECGVQMLMQVDLPSFPVQCSVPGSGRKLVVNIDCVAWLNFSTGYCWVEPTPELRDSSRPWRYTDEEEGFRKLIA